MDGSWLYGEISDIAWPVQHWGTWPSGELKQDHRKRQMYLMKPCYISGKLLVVHILGPRRRGRRGEGSGCTAEKFMLLGKILSSRVSERLHKRHPRPNRMHIYPVRIHNRMALLHLL
jgi:hypothetical protein